jgi:hypothetical protein
MGIADTKAAIEAEAYVSIHGDRVLVDTAPHDPAIVLHPDELKSDEVRCCIQFATGCIRWLNVLRLTVIDEATYDRLAEGIVPHTQQGH